MKWTSPIVDVSLTYNTSSSHLYYIYLEPTSHICSTTSHLIFSKLNHNHATTCLLWPTNPVLLSWHVDFISAGLCVVTQTSMTWLLPLHVCCHTSICLLHLLFICFLWLWTGIFCFLWPLFLIIKGQIGLLTSKSHPVGAQLHLLQYQSAANSHTFGLKHPPVSHWPNRCRMWTPFPWLY